MHPFYITTPIYYLNGAPHLGHAYTTIFTDTVTRFWRLAGRPTYFLTGTDEHGQKIVEAATKAGLPPQGFVDNAYKPFYDMNAEVGAQPSDFIRTTEDRHKRGAEALWKKIDQNGWIEKGVYAGWYAVRDEAFYKEADIKDGKAPTGAPVAWVEEPCYFFKLSAFRDKLLDFYRQNPDFILPKTRYNETISWVEQGLQDLAISRSTLRWGIPVPGDEAHVMYVWIDALSNYITGLGYPEKTKIFETFWPHARQVIGKDILRFHAIYWPAFLMAADVSPPRQLYIHGWWTVEGEKMSKSVGNVLSPTDLVALFGIDPLRYFLLRQMPFGDDGNFSKEAFAERFRSDLANDLGNLFQRVLAFIQKRGGTIPPNPQGPVSKDIDAWRRHLWPQLEGFMTSVEPHRYLTHIWEGVALGNRFFDALEPWKLAKSDTPEDLHRLDSGLFQMLTLLYDLALYLQPVMPEAAKTMLAQLGYEGEPLPFHNETFRLTEGASLPKPWPLFQKDRSAA